MRRRLIHRVQDGIILIKQFRSVHKSGNYFPLQSTTTIISTHYFIFWLTISNDSSISHLVMQLNEVVPISCCGNTCNSIRSTVVFTIYCIRAKSSSYKDDPTQRIQLRKIARHDDGSHGGGWPREHYCRSRYSRWLGTFHSFSVAGGDSSWQDRHIIPRLQWLDIRCSQW